MRWFKHMTCSGEDERLSELIAEHGLEAYGFWWRLLEVVAGRMEKGSEKCSATYPLPAWSRLLYCHHHKVGKYLGKLGVMGMVTVRYEEGNGSSKIEVTIPNLLKYRDEYSKKSGQKNDKIPTDSGAKNTDTDTDTDTETEENKTLSTTPSEVDLPVPKIPPCPYTAIVSLYHKILPSLPTVREVTPEMERTIQNRWRESKDRQNLEYWTGYFEYVSKSDFLMGRKTDFHASLAWLVGPKNFAKVWAGQYENGTAVNSGGRQQAEYRDPTRGCT